MIRLHTFYASRDLNVTRDVTATIQQLKQELHDGRNSSYWSCANWYRRMMHNGRHQYDAQVEQDK